MNIILPIMWVALIGFGYFITSLYQLIIVVILVILYIFLLKTDDYLKELYHYVFWALLIAPISIGNIIRLIVEHHALIPSVIR